MNIYLWNNGEESGPFTRNEIFSKLSAHEIDLQIQARTEKDVEWKTLEEVLSGGLAGLLSVEQIVDTQPAPPPPPVIVSNPPSFDPDPADTETPRKSHKTIFVGGAITAVAFGGILLLLMIREEDQPHAKMPDAATQHTSEAKQSNVVPSEDPGPVADLDHTPSSSEQEDRTDILSDDKGQASQLPAPIAISEQSAASPSPSLESGSEAMQDDDSVSGHPDDSSAVAAENDSGESITFAADESPSPALIAATASAQTQSQPAESLGTAPETSPPSRSQVKPDVAIDPQRRFHPFDMPQVDEAELADILRERFSAPPIKLLDSSSGSLDPYGTVEQDSFLLDTHLKWNPQVEVVYRIPLRSKSSSGRNADNIVMVGIYAGGVPPPNSDIESPGIGEKKEKIRRELAAFSDEFGFTAFTLYFNHNEEMLRDPRESYFMGGDEWADIVFRAQDEIARRHKLKPRKLLLYGHSLGGTFVQRIAANKPERVAAVALQSASGISLLPSCAQTAWFLAITRGDGMRDEYDRLYNVLAANEGTFAFSIFPPDYTLRGNPNYYHSQSHLESLASRLFLQGVVERYDSSGNIIPTRWPYVRDRTKPLRIYPTGSRQAKDIPSESREFLPSRRFAQCLQAIPAPLHCVKLEDQGAGSVQCFIGVPPLGRPKGVLVYAHKYGFADLPSLFDNIYYLAEKGFVVVAPKFRKEADQELQVVFNYLKTSDVFRKLPLVCVGNGGAGNHVWDVAANDRKSALKAIAMIDFDPKSSLDESKLPLGSGIKCPAFFIYDERPLTTAATSVQAAMSLEKIGAIKTFVEKCKERRQLAGVTVIGKKAEANLQTAQRSIEQAAYMLTCIVEGHAGELKFSDL